MRFKFAKLERNGTTFTFNWNASLRRVAAAASFHVNNSSSFYVFGVWQQQLVIHKAKSRGEQTHSRIKRRRGDRHVDHIIIIIMEIDSIKWWTKEEDDDDDDHSLFVCFTVRFLLTPFLLGALLLLESNQIESLSSPSIVRVGLSPSSEAIVRLRNLQHNRARTAVNATNFHSLGLLWMQNFPPSEPHTWRFPPPSPSLQELFTIDWWRVGMKPLQI